jgi:hypothetical protein
LAWSRRTTASASCRRPRWTPSSPSSASATEEGRGCCAGCGAPARLGRACTAAGAVC